MDEHVIAGRYRPLEQLGRGGMGVVWRARDLRLGRVVAMKVLHPWVADDPELRERFEREAAALARLEHPNVVRLYDVLEDRGQTVLVMELVEGEALDTSLAGAPRTWDDARKLCAPVAAALAHAHARGVVHRDLTPANILVERGSGRLVVTDFGLARLARSSRSAPVSGVLAGTPEYWAPEQASGEATGPATDLYALGCILYRALSGRLPFEGEDRLATGLRRAHEAAPSLQTAEPGAPPEAVALVDRLLAREPSRRGTATDAAVELGASRATLPVDPDDVATVIAPRAVETLVTRVLHETATVVRPRLSQRAARPHGRVSAALLVVTALIALAGGGVYALASQDPPGIDAPDVDGLGVTAARKEVGERTGGDVQAPKVKVVDRSYSESAPVGVIIAQDPPEGERIREGGVLLVSVSRGSAYADVPSVAGLAGAEAFALLERSGFTPTRRYAPSTEIESWHAVATDPQEGTNVKRPARVALVVSTGPPKRAVPSLEDLRVDDASRALEDAGFTPVVEERADTSVAEGTVLGTRPAPGTRAPIGSNVTIVVARAPRWEPISSVDSTEDATQPIVVPAGARLALATTDTSPLGLWGGHVDVRLEGGAEGEARVDAGDSLVLADASDAERTIRVGLDVDGSVHWTLSVEVAR